jgi:HK97 gp10 family phage protein
MSTAAKIAADLNGLVKKTKHQAMSRAVLTVEAASKREAPVKTGNLRRTITSRVEQGGDRGVIGTNASYARPVHEGSRPHIIRPVNAKALFWKGASHPVRIVKHPGNKANKFFERAAQSSRAAVERELAGVFQGALARVG